MLKARRCNSTLRSSTSFSKKRDGRPRSLGSPHTAPAERGECALPHLCPILAQVPDREWVLDFLAFALSTVYGYLVRVPKWLMYIISGGAASVIINLMHKPSAQARARAQAQRPAPKPKQPVMTSSASDVGESTATAKSEGVSKRKGNN